MGNMAGLHRGFQVAGKTDQGAEGEIGNISVGVVFHQRRQSLDLHRDLEVLGHVAAVLPWCERRSQARRASEGKSLAGASGLLRNFRARVIGFQLAGGIADNSTVAILLVDPDHAVDSDAVGGDFPIESLEEGERFQPGNKINGVLVLLAVVAIHVDDKRDAISLVSLAGLEEIGCPTFLVIDQFFLAQGATEPASGVIGLDNGFFLEAELFVFPVIQTRNAFEPPGNVRGAGGIFSGTFFGTGMLYYT